MLSHDRVVILLFIDVVNSASIFTDVMTRRHNCGRAEGTDQADHLINHQLATEQRIF